MTIPLATLACTIGPDGISAPIYDDIYLTLVAKFQGIYGSDVVISADNQDGQLLGIFAQAQADSNAATIAAYNAFSPATAQGAGLSSVVKINGLAREASTFSTCDVTITGTAGTVITNGTVKDTAGFVWALPASVTIPIGASITVTTTCQMSGAISAAIGTLTIINTPTQGWLSVTNATSAAVGVAAETDAALRQRQSISTAISAHSPMETIKAAVANVSGVSRVTYDENTTSTTNGNGTPGHSFALVVEGGDAIAIATTITETKGPGSGTAGTVSEVIIDQYGIPNTIKFSRPTYERIVVNVSIHVLTGYTVQIGTNIVNAIAAYIEGLAMGESVYLTQVIAAAIQGSGAPTTFNLTALTMCIFGGTPTAADIAIAYNQSATCQASDVALSLV